MQTLCGCAHSVFCQRKTPSCSGGPGPAVCGGLRVSPADDGAVKASSGRHPSLATLLSLIISLSHALLLYLLHSVLWSLFLPSVSHSVCVTI